MYSCAGYKRINELDTAIKIIRKYNDHIGMVHALGALQFIRVLIQRSESEIEILQLCLCKAYFIRPNRSCNRPRCYCQPAVSCLSSDI